MKTVYLAVLLCFMGCVGAGDDFEVGTEEEAAIIDGPPNCSGSCCNNSPILITVGGGNPMLTSGTTDGVHFDINSDGTKPLINWTARTGNTWFLVLDRDGDHKITSGSELFGTATPQRVPPGQGPNGFRALSMFDDNHDGVINAADEVWPALQLWLDFTHDGISQSYELVPVSAYVTSISLNYTNSNHYQDANGNLMWYSAPVTGKPGGPAMGLGWDVYFAQQTAKTGCAGPGGGGGGGDGSSWEWLGGLIDPTHYWPSYACAQDVFITPIFTANPLYVGICGGTIDPVSHLFINPGKTPYTSPYNRFVYIRRVVSAVTPRNFTADGLVEFAADLFAQHRNNEALFHWYVGVYPALRPYCVMTDRNGTINPPTPDVYGPGCRLTGGLNDIDALSNAIEFTGALPDAFGRDGEFIPLN